MHERNEKVYKMLFLKTTELTTYKIWAIVERYYHSGSYYKNRVSHCWPQSASKEEDSTADSCEHGKETSGSSSRAKFVDEPSDY